MLNGTKKAFCNKFEFFSHVLVIFSVDQNKIFRLLAFWI